MAPTKNGINDSAHPGTLLSPGNGKTPGDFWGQATEPFKEWGKIPMGDWFVKHGGFVFGEALIIATAAAILLGKKKR
jgi:hypothetical protein